MENNSNIYNQNNWQDIKYFSDYQEYYLIKENIIYKILIDKNNEEIFIICKNYYISLNIIDISSLTNIKFNSLNKAYEYISNFFEDNKVIIKDVIKNKEIKLILNNERKIELALKYNRKNTINNNCIYHDIEEIKKEINNLKEENKKLKKEIDKLKKVPEKKIKLKLLSNIRNDSYAHYTIDNSFITFNSINKILYLIYANKNKSIICYDLNDQKIITELKNAHNNYITNFRHYLEEKNKRDLMMSISTEDNNIKIWNVNNWECILNFENINNVGRLYSACFLNKENKTYIITSNNNLNGISNPIKIFDLKGRRINEIKNSNKQTIFIDTYYDNNLSKYYIITGNAGFSQSYDYDKNKIYRKYNNNSVFSFLVNNDNGIIKLITSCSDGNIRIFNFHSGLLLNKIKVSNQILYGICLWNDNYLFTGSKDGSIKLLEIKKEIYVKSFDGHFEQVLTIKKINHSKYGECLISHNWKESEIKLWINDI